MSRKAHNAPGFLWRKEAKEHLVSAIARALLQFQEVNPRLTNLVHLELPAHKQCSKECSKEGVKNKTCACGCGCGCVSECE